MNECIYFPIKILPFLCAGHIARDNDKWAQMQSCIYVPFESIQHRHKPGTEMLASAEDLVVTSEHTHCSSFHAAFQLAEWLPIQFSRWFDTVCDTDKFPFSKMYKIICDLLHILPTDCKNFTVSVATRINFESPDALILEISFSSTPRSQCNSNHLFKSKDVSSSCTIRFFRLGKATGKIIVCRRKSKIMIKKFKINN